MPYNNRVLIQAGGVLPPYPPPSVAFTPNSVSGLLLWLDFSGLVSNTTNAYGSVDGSGNITKVNNLKTGATDDFRASANWPTLGTGGGPNSDKNYGDFDGATAMQWLNYFNNGSASSSSWAAPYTAIAVVKRKSTSTQFIGLGYTGTNSAADREVYIPSWWSSGIPYFPNASNYFTPPTHNVSAWAYIGAAPTSGTTASFYFNGASEATTNTADTVTSNFDQFGRIGQDGPGANSSYGFQICEFIYYDNTTVSGTDLTNLWNYITGKYGAFP